VKPRPALSVVIPAYNEESRLAPTIREIAAYFRSCGRSSELIVVDDGSRDGTSALVSALTAEYEELRLIRLPTNRGKGYAVRSGVVNSAGQYVLFADADGSTPIAEIERLETAVLAGADIAIGSRALASSEVKVKARLYRRLMGRLFHGFVRLLTVRGIRDTQCGFKLFRSPVAHELFSRSRLDGFAFDVEVLFMAQRFGHRVAEIPVNWVHKAGSRVNLVLDSLRMARDLLQIRLYALQGAYDTPRLAPWYSTVGQSG
jgi:dolichyl-phosphate beta-glucosyltransferase